MEARSEGFLVRRPNYKKREEAKRFKIITNGTKTEAGYFVRLNRLSTDNIEVETKKGFSLDEMLKSAQKIIAKSDGGYDEVCIVLDIDEQMDTKKEKARLKKFIENAKDAGVPVYMSNESFEIWLLSHKITVPKSASKREIATKLALKEGLLDGERRKEVVEEEITIGSVKHALMETSRLRKEYGEDITKSKPMTDVDLLVSRVRLKITK